MTRNTAKSKPQYSCEFCKKSFVRERTLYSHTCEKKRRWLSKDDKYTQMGFIVFRKFYEMNFIGHKPREFKDFMNSSYYTSFVKFGKYLIDIQALNPTAFVEFLIRSEVPLRKWENEYVYQTYLNELIKRESPESAMTRNVKLMQEWEAETGEPWYDFFKKVNTNLAVRWIRSGRISPWVLFTAGTAESLIERFTDEQIEIVERYTNPKFWSIKFNEKPDDVQFIKSLLSEAGV